MTALMIITAILGAGSALFGVFAIATPGALAGAPGTQFYARMYASRAVPMVAIAIAMLANLAVPAAAAPWLLLAGVLQISDAVIGLIRRSPGMVAASLITAAVHLATVVLVVSA